jgi:hypothetical protein
VYTHLAITGGINLLQITILIGDRRQMMCIPNAGAAEALPTEALMFIITSNYFWEISLYTIYSI